MKATKIPSHRLFPKCALMLLIGGLIALQGSALGHDHGELSELFDLSDSLDCPCVHADKVEWITPVAPPVGELSIGLSTYIPADFPLALFLSFLPVRARSPPLA